MQYQIGQKVRVENIPGEYVIVGLSCMTHDDEDAGEPEWKIHKEVKEVAIADYAEGVIYQKPCWVKVSQIL